MKKAFILASSAVLFAACQGGEPQLGKASIDKVLRAMTRELKPGESETITLHVDAYGLASFNEKSSAWEAAAGEYNVCFAENSRDVRASVLFNLGEAKSWPVHDVLAPKQPIEKLL